MVVDLRLTYDPLVIPNDLPQDGAQVIFQGIVRPISKEKEVLRLEFEAYQPMAISELEIIALDIRSKWPQVNKVLLHHRLGVVLAGEVAVIACVTAPHRVEAFAGCEYLMNRLKETVPIWKKECYSDGHYWVSSTP